MKNRILVSLLYIIVFVSGCTKQEIIDGGLSVEKHESSMLAYLNKDKYNWELTVEMIKRAGLEPIFEGKVDTLKEITFFGPTSFSILRHLYDNKLDRVDQLTTEFCRETILKHIVKNRILKKDLPFRNRAYYIFDPNQSPDNYKEVTTLGNAKLRLYLEKTAYGDVPDAGPIIMYTYSMSGNTFIPLASPDIQSNNGVAHSLNYNYKLNNI